VIQAYPDTVMPSSYNYKLPIWPPVLMSLCLNNFARVGFCFWCNMKVRA